MFCGKCGAKLDDDSTFCSECGAKVEKPEFQIPNQIPDMGAFQAYSPVPGQNPGQNWNHNTTQPKLKWSERWKKMGIKEKAVCIAVVIVLLCGVAVYWYNNSIVRLDPYISVEFTGYDGIGHAVAVFDDKAFIKDYGSKLKLETEADNFLEELSGNIENSALEILESGCINYDLDKTDYLKNGDEVTLVWDCEDSSFESMFGKKLKYSEMIFTAEGLQEIELIDPFEKVEIICEGISPKGYLSISIPEDSEEYIQNLWYSITPNSELANGDTVKLSVLDYDEEYYAEKYGIGFSCKEKSYTVSGLGEYVSSAADISEDMLGQMTSQGKDEFAAYAAKNWEREVSLDHVEYVGNYFLNAKGSNSYDSNRLILVYKVDSTITPENGEQTKVSYYTYITYRNIIKADEETIVDLQQYERCSDSFYVEIDTGGWWNSRYWFYGYRNLNELYQQAVVAYSDEFVSEDHIED